MNDPASRDDRRARPEQKALMNMGLTSNGQGVGQHWHPKQPQPEADPDLRQPVTREPTGQSHCKDRPSKANCVQGQIKGKGGVHPFESATPCQ